jgi:hypothetical protein
LSLGLHQGQGAPAAPHVQACSPSHGLPGCSSQTQPQSSQSKHFMASCFPGANRPACARADRSGHVFLPSTPLDRAIPENRRRCTRQTVAPSSLERRAGGLKACNTSIPLLARPPARVEPAMPLPGLCGIRDARALDDHADANAGIVDVPSHAPILDAFAGEGGHAPLKRVAKGRATYPGYWFPPKR